MKKYDVIVVGAGPAGSTAARFCAKASLRTLLLEKGRLPRFKPCAGGVTRAALNELDFELPKNIIERECNGLRACFNDHSNDVRYDSTVAYMVKRDKFDKKLADMAREAGAELRDSEACRKVTRDSKGVTVHTDINEYTGNILIGADGFFSKVLKYLRGGFDKKEMRYCLIADIPMSEKEVTERMGDYVELRFGFVDYGYAWLFPKRNCISAGIGGKLQHSKALSQKFKEILKIWGFRPDLRTRGCFLPVSTFNYNVFTERIMLAGDAAGFVDSFSGEGIRFAIISGKIASETAIRCHSKGRFTRKSLRYYHDRCFDAFGYGLKQSNKLTDSLFRFPGLILGEAIERDEILIGYLKTLTGELDFLDLALPFKKMVPRLLFKKAFAFTGIPRFWEQRKKKPA